MATARVGNHQPFGSSEWIVKEFNEISTICDNELEDFTFSARNEVEWLNEHMNEIFSNNKIRLAEILKTPGKLRGKTPRTARQRSPLKVIRHPLGKITPIDKLPSSSRHSRTGQSPAAAAAAFEEIQEAVTNLEQSEVRNETQATYDSGYHENSDKEIEVELPPSQDLEHDEKMYNGIAAEGPPQRSIHYELPKPLRERDEEGRLTEGSFHSAEESQVAKANTVNIQSAESPEAKINDAGAKASEQLRRESGQLRELSNNDLIGIQLMSRAEVDGYKEETQVEKLNDIASENPTPIMPAKRGLSMSLPTLPEREPIGSKKSTGNYRGSSQAQSFNRLTIGKLVGTAVPAEHDADINESEDMETQQPSDAKSGPTSHPAKSLHDRITALGKTRESRSTKSILPNIVPLSQPVYPTLLDDESGPRELTSTDKDADSRIRLTEKQTDENWITHAVPDSVSTSPVGKTNTAEKATEKTLTHPMEDQAASSSEQLNGRTGGDEPSIACAAPTHDAVTNPHGLMSSSKSRLQTLFSSAKGLFTSSAATSSLARLEVAADSLLGQEANVQVHAGTTSSADVENGVSQPFGAQDENSYSRVAFDLRDEAAELHARQEKSKKADSISKKLQSAIEEPQSSRSTTGTAGALHKPIMKMTKEQPVQQTPVTRLESMTGRGPLIVVPFPGLQKEQEQPHGRTAADKKESLSSTATIASSASSHKGSINPKTKVALAADRKREADLKASQKKAIKLDLERKKAARQQEAQEREHTRQAVERQKERERQTVEEKKRQDLREAIDRKRADAQAKREPHKEHKITLKSTYTKQMPKRVWQPEPEEEIAGSMRNLATKTVRPPQHAGKRLRTEEEEEEEEEMEKPHATRPIVQPPTRESIIKSALNPILLNKNYSRAPPAAVRHAGDVQQSADAPVTHQHIPPRPQTALDNARFGNGAIPFATHPAQVQAGQKHQPPSEGFFKTPMQHPRLGQTGAQLQLQQQQLPRSSPIDGEIIHLSDPPTDSEEEDSETERQKKADIPNWARSPFLNNVLLAQDSIEPSLVFGPMPPLDMEEMFKGRGPRRDFRNRTSSANWVGGDRLTEDEVQKDIEARQKMRRDGGWTMELS